MTRLTLGAAAIAVVLAIFGQPAAAATRIVDFDFGPDVAAGQFSYDNGLTGVIGYDDLDAFSLTFAGTGNTYDLAFVRSGDISSYQGFAFDTASLTFVVTSVGGVPQIMSAIRNGFTQGFFFRDDGDVRAATDYAGDGELTFETLDISSRVIGMGVPEPGVWTLMIAGFGLAGASLRRRRAAWA